jgi:hypothetical protein
MEEEAPSPGGHQSHRNDFRCSLAESLEQLAAASQRLADLVAKAIGVENVGNDVERDGSHLPGLGEARQTLMKIFDVGGIEGYNGSESMEKARMAHFNAALEMYIVMAEDTSPESIPEINIKEDLASRIGHALFRELLEYYRETQRGNERVTFTTEQRTALESAFLLKPKLNMAEKRALAKTCNLNPRQVEVWVRVRLFTKLILFTVFQPPYPKKTRRKTNSNASCGTKLRVIGRKPLRTGSFESIKGLERPRIKQRRKSVCLEWIIALIEHSRLLYIYPQSNFITFPMEALKVQAENLDSRVHSVI